MSIFLTVTVSSVSFDSVGLCGRATGVCKIIDVPKLFVELLSRRRWTIESDIRLWCAFVAKELLRIKINQRTRDLSGILKSVVQTPEKR